MSEKILAVKEPKGPTYEIVSMPDGWKYRDLIGRFAVPASPRRQLVLPGEWVCMKAKGFRRRLIWPKSCFVAYPDKPPKRKFPITQGRIEVLRTIAASPKIDIGVLSQKLKRRIHGHVANLIYRNFIEAETIYQSKEGGGRKRTRIFAITALGKGFLRQVDDDLSYALRWEEGRPSKKVQARGERGAEART